MKLLTHGIADIDHAITKVDLTTQFLHGLDKRLDTICVVLGDQSLPFDTVLSRVVLAEESQAQRAAKESASAFALSGGSSSGGPSGASGRGQSDRGERSTDRAQGAPHPAPPNPDRGRGDRTGDGGDYGRGRGRGDNGGRGQHQPAPFHPFTGYFAPYGMALPSPRAGWIPSNAAGVLGPRPGSHLRRTPSTRRRHRPPRSTRRPNRRGITSLCATPPTATPTTPPLQLQSGTSTTVLLFM